MEGIKLLIADDHALLRAGLRDVLSEDPSLTIIAECKSGVEACQSILALGPDIAILDIDMPGMSGFEVAEKVKREKSGTKLLALTMHHEASFFNRAMDLGFLGYVLKDGTITDIRDAVKTVKDGRHYISPILASLALNRGDHVSLSNIPALALLTHTEKRVLKLISENHSTREIAELMFVSSRTIDTHRSNIASKLELKGPNALVRYAFENKHLF
jgi:two-component system, NarL family, response regulator DegU